MNTQVYPYYLGAVSKDFDNVRKSSSGGIFFELCREIIRLNGVVYGAALDTPLTVFHKRAETLDEAKAFRKSKYLRSRIGPCFESVKKDLEEGRIVLFSGVGCQIAGLYHYLGQEFSNLITCEVVCHGAPIRRVLEKYVSEQEDMIGGKLTDIEFRDKREGWSRNCIAERYDNGRECLNLSSNHPVHRLYLKGMNMEKGCGQCQYQRLPRVADITLADFWKCQGQLQTDNHDMGISLIAINHAKGAQFFNRIKRGITWIMVEEKEALDSCRHMSQKPYEHPSREAFEQLITMYDFSFLYPMVEEFGELVLPGQLKILDKEDSDEVIKILLADTNEIVYFVDENGSMQGIAAFGEFITKYSSGNFWINRNSRRVTISQGCAKEIRAIFKESSKINRIPVLDETGRICFEVRRTCGANGKKDGRKLLLAYALLKRNRVDCLYVNRPDFLAGFCYSLRQQVRIQEQISFPVILSEPAKYEKEGKDLFGEKYSRDYIKKLGDIPPIIKIGDSYMHTDQDSCYVNVAGGKRLTTGSPEEYVFSIHVYGRCGAFGYAVEDKDTIPSVLQELLRNRQYEVRVVNHGLWGADDEIIISNLLADLGAGDVCPGDIVICYMGFSKVSREWKPLSELVIDTTEEFHLSLNEGCNFYDKPGHMTAAGYRRIAELIFCELQKRKLLGDMQRRKGDFIKDIDIERHAARDQELINYIEEAQKSLSFETGRTQEIIGAIVMNCNPFTLGHRYLIEKARADVDRLIIFVVEEDKSFFPFELRFEMVCRGVEDLDRVYILPSGKFMISSMTFPEYFTKEENPAVIVTPAYDVKIFAECIAPAFHITKRFAGTEPEDAVTAQYNQTLREILPRYGIQFKEIDRYKKGSGYVTATAVRNCMKQGNFHILHDFLPKSTIQILQENHMLGE